ncbi:lactate racemase domain-containing protein [Acuticoccus sp. I52.16.1]|uniref:lactate racemase domain-containing protein n=1 Tax=Acuticoccus sp. I52.16.1 TaxID=2928472 RepID=UPI001FD5E9FB|nr:lactate racemase domain-containing protein [Acuticoccus sp. I52.16.1]UOM33175.1 nickel-dependent lactate racemase [Acuticoccus sp. I52.16.1]
MEVLERLIGDIALPKMVRVRQRFADDHVADVAAAVVEGIEAPAIAERIRPGMSVAIAVGSRGLADLPTLVAATVKALKAAGAEPFIVPAMGSHGGATAEGQALLLNGMGVTEGAVGAPIRSSMETVSLGNLPNGLPVLMDRHAMEADGIVVINRVKAHTSFSAPIESGLAKMITIGLGKQDGAASCHAMGFAHMAGNVVDMARVKLETCKILFGVATVENGYDRICRVEVVPAEAILTREPELLKESKARMPRIMFDPLDVLVVDKMGKEFSGTGMDPNITGRATTSLVQSRLSVTRMVVLDLTAKGGGNATGIGLADATTRKLYEKIDLVATYANHITSTVMSGCKIPMILNSDRMAIMACIRTANVMDLSTLRLVRVPNTLHIGEIQISEALLPDARANPDIEILSEPEAMVFDAAGDFAELEAAH